MVVGLYTITPLLIGPNEGQVIAAYEICTHSNNNYTKPYTVLRVISGGENTFVVKQ